MFQSWMLVALLTSGQDEKAVATQERPDGFVAELNGQVILEEEYKDWLLAHHGWSYLDSYLELVALRQEAARIAAAATPEDLDQAFERFWADQVLFRFKGQEDKYLEQLRQAGMDKEGLRARKLATLERDVLAQKIVLHRRDPSEEALRTLFEEEFGNGLRIRLQVAFFDRFRDLEPTRTPTTGVIERLDEATKARAQGFQDKVVADPDLFPELVKSESDGNLIPRFDAYVRDLRLSGGELPRFKRGLFLGALDELVYDEATAVNEWHGPVASNSGYYVYRILERSPVTFEEVREELFEFYRTRPVTGREIHFLAIDLIEKAEVEKAPHFRVR